MKCNSIPFMNNNTSPIIKINCNNYYTKALLNHLQNMAKNQKYKKY